MEKFRGLVDSEVCHKNFFSFLLCADGWFGLFDTSTSLGTEMNEDTPIQLVPALEEGQGIGLNADMTDEILLQLPVESLSKFKAVCKGWNSTISASRFERYYIEKNANKPYIVFFEKLGGCVGPSARLYNLLDSTTKAVGLPRFDGKAVPVGSCNGLIAFRDVAPPMRRGLGLALDLLEGRVTFVLWNPWTREEKRVQWMTRSHGYKGILVGYIYSCS